MQRASTAMPSSHLTVGGCHIAHTTLRSWSAINNSVFIDYPKNLSSISLVLDFTGFTARDMLFIDDLRATDNLQYRIIRERRHRNLLQRVC
jgi:hypothetical protein